MSDTTTEPAAGPEHQPAVETGDGRREIVVRLDQIEFRDAGNPDKPHETTLRGHAALFNSLSDDLGGFREIIEPGFFRSALRKRPDVRLLFNHDPNHVLARTASDTLELREDGRGLHVFARINKEIQWVKDLRASMQRGDIDQMSFAFTLKAEGDDWAVTEDGTVVRTLRADGADDLFDVSVVTYPAYRATHVTMRGLLEEAAANGRLVIPGAGPDVDPETGGSGRTASTSHPHDGVGEPAAHVATVETREGEETTNGPDELAAIKAESHEAVRAARERHLLTLKGLV